MDPGRPHLLHGDRGIVVYFVLDLDEEQTAAGGRLAFPQGRGVWVTNCSNDRVLWAREEGLSEVAADA